MAAWVVAPVAAGVVAGLDRITKAAVARRSLEGVELWRRGPFAVRHVVNRRGGLVALPVVPLAVALVAVVAAAAALLAASDGPAWAWASLGAASGGAIGNLGDRWRRGAVVDFAVVGRWPAFNVADVGLVAAMVAATVGTVAGR